MAKPRDQKRQEAAYRKIRGEMIRLFLNNQESELRDRIKGARSDDYVRQDAELLLVKREEALRSFLALPAEWRETALDGQHLGTDLPGRLAEAHAQQRSEILEKVLGNRATSRGATKPRI